MITYRSNKTDTLHAAYLGNVRVGYVEQRGLFNRYVWQLSISLGPSQLHFGREDTWEEAHDALQAALDHWIASAGLQLKEKIS